MFKIINVLHRMPYGKNRTMKLLVLSCSDIRFTLHSYLRYEIRATPIRDALGGATSDELFDSCRKYSTNHSFLCKTKPISPSVQMVLSQLITSDYVNFRSLMRVKNKAKTKPKRTQLKPILC